MRLLYRIYGGGVVSQGLRVGLNKKIDILVTDKLSAASIGSGLLDVFATPAMIALMEQAAAECVRSYLQEGQDTVGIKVDIVHTAATPVGSKVWANAQLIEMDGRKLVFRVEAFDEKEKIGEGIHQRFIIDVQRFMQKVSVKRSKE